MLSEQTTLTPEMVRNRVERVRAASDDDEVAHGLEDQLHQDVLRAIAERRAEDPSLCAFIALDTLNIEFSRWCA